MNLYVLDKNFSIIGIIDSYESLIWSERYNECSDFELTIPITNAPLNFLKPGNYIKNTNSKKTMIIESVPIEDNAEEEDIIIVSGRSLESLLDRRIIWGQKVISTNVEEAIFSILNENVIAPDDTSRAIDNIILQASGNSDIEAIQIESQYYGEGVYKTIETICKSYNLGFKMELNSENKMVFQLYMGTDRSFAQTENQPVIFSPDFDNLIRSKYIESNKTYKNIGLIGGEGEGTERKTATVGDETITGLDRREIFIEVSVSSNSNSIGEAKYYEQLKARGNEELAEYSPIYTFEAEAEPNGMFKYGVDYFVGDIVQMTNEYGIKIRARITEIVMSYSDSGINIIPTFNAIQGG